MTDLRKYTNAFAVAAILFFGVSLVTGGKGCDWTPGPVVDPVVVPVVKVTAVVYCWEKDEAPMPSAVRDALDTLNKQGIVATEFEQGTKNGKGETPKQYIVPLAAAKVVGLPALVVMDGDKVIRTVKAPKTAPEVLEAAKP